MKGTTAASASLAIFRRLQTVAKKIGARPEGITRWSPKEAQIYVDGGRGAWVISWEEGEYEWAYDLTMDNFLGVSTVDATGYFAEPVNSYQVAFYADGEG